MVMKNVNPTTTKSWKALQEYFDKSKSTLKLKDLFKDQDRFNKYSFTIGGDLLADLSKNLVDEKVLKMLLDLANECDLKQDIEAMFTGEKINRSEDRAALHTALRNFSGNPVYVDGVDVMPDVKRVQAKMKAFSEKVISGEWKGYTGKEH